MQRELVKEHENATIVPIIVGTDKTAMTQHHGDTEAWPIYISIGNLSSRTRHSQTRPGMLLLGLLPLLPGASTKKDKYLKSSIYHEALSMIFHCECFPAADFHWQRSLIRALNMYLNIYLVSYTVANVTSN